jgi:AraC-like DNA-binding protein
VSEAHFARCFKQAFGLPPHRYLLTRRIERATALLRDTDLPITDIAFGTGWSSLGTFGRTFRDITGENPRTIRERARADAQGLERVPVCVLSAAHRPDLTIAVSEKRRRLAAGTKTASKTPRKANEPGSRSSRSVRARPGRSARVLREGGVPRPHGRAQR